MLEHIMQDKVLQLVTQIEDVAVDLKLKIRLLDAIRDIKNKLKRPLTTLELKQVMVEIDELVHQLKKQVEPTINEIVVNEFVTITEEDIQNRIKGILSETNRVSATLAKENIQGYESYLVETETAMWDFAKAEANYDTLINPQRLKEKFTNIGKRHNSQMNTLTDRYIDETAENYDHAIKQIGTMFSEIKDSRIVFGQKELYQQWTEKYDVVKSNLKEMTEVIDKGGDEVVGFCNEHERSITKMIGKIKKKYTGKKCIPLYALILIGFIVLAMNIVSTVSEEKKDSVETESISTEQQDSLANDVGDILDTIIKNKDTLKDTYNLLSGKEKTVKTNNIWLTVLAVFVYGVLWYRWIHVQNKKCKAAICEETSKYIGQQLDIFKKEQRLQRRTELGYEETVKMVLATYEDVFANIFADVLYDERKDENSATGRLLFLCNEWEIIKRGNYNGN